MKITATTGSSPRCARKSAAACAALSAEVSGSTTIQPVFPRIQLTFETSNSGEPAWSPDGTQIVFSSTRLGGREVWVMDADGSDPVRLTSTVGINGDPVWFGTQIAFESSRTGAFEIFLMNDDGTNQVALTSGGTNSVDPHWSPDGTMLTFERSNDIFTMDADGSNVVNRTNSAAGDHNPSWGPGSIAP